VLEAAPRSEAARELQSLAELIMANKERLAA
jgi:hypothetical protein